MSSSKYKLLMISGDRALAQGKKGGFYYMLEEFSKYWDRIDIICPVRNQKISKAHGNVYVHGSDTNLVFHPLFISKKGADLYGKHHHDLMAVHEYPPFYNGIGARLLHRETKIPYVLEIMHITGYPKAGDFKEWFYKIMTRLLIKCDTSKSQAVRVINSRQTPEFLKRCGVPEDKMKIIPAFYIDLDVFKPRDIAKKYDLVFSGRLVKNKGIFLLLEAIKKIKIQKSKCKTINQNAKLSKLKLIIVGAGPLRKGIEKFIKRHGLENNVFFSGWLATADDLANAYNQSKIFVMPSFNEGGPRTPLEAMACGVPVITSRVGIMLDIVKNGENGIFIDWDSKDIAEKVLLLLKDENLRKKIAENGHQTVQQFERKKMLRNYAMNYRGLIGNKSS